MVLFCEFLGTKSDARHLCRCGIDYFFTERAPNGAFLHYPWGNSSLLSSLLATVCGDSHTPVGAGRLLLLRVVQRRTKVAVLQRLHAPSGVSGQHSAAVRMPRAFFGSVVHIVGFVVDFSVI